LDDYRANPGDSVAIAQAEIDQLLAQPLQARLPDVSGALRALNAIVGAPPSQPIAEGATAAEPVAVSPAPALPQAQSASLPDEVPVTAAAEDTP
jgi:hypothetical protein